MEQASDVRFFGRLLFGPGTQRRDLELWPETNSFAVATGASVRMLGSCKHKARGLLHNRHSTLWVPPAVFNALSRLRRMIWNRHSAQSLCMHFVLFFTTYVFNARVSHSCHGTSHVLQFLVGNSRISLLFQSVLNCILLS